MRPATRKKNVQTMLLLLGVCCLASAQQTEETTDVTAPEGTESYSKTETEIGVETTEAPATIPPPVPDAPWNIQVEERTTDSLEISWEQPEEAEECEVQLDCACGDVAANCSLRTAMISNLPGAGKEYSITVTAILGDQRNSTEIQERTRPPSPVLTYVAKETTEDTIVLAVRVPGNNSTCEIEEVIVESEPGSWTFDLTSCVTSEEQLLQDLTPGSEYNFTAKAAVGGINSSESEQVTGPTAPSKPEIQKVTSDTSSMNVIWAQRPGENKDLSKQEVAWSCANLEKSVEVATSATDYSVQGLSPGSKCNVSVIVYTEHVSKTYDAKDTWQEWTVGAAPENVTYSVTETTVLATWDDPNSDTSYYLLNCLCEQSDCEFDTQNVTENTATCGGLTSGTEYSITVTAVVNNINYSTNARTEFTIAAVPESFTVETVNDTVLQVDWTEPSGGCRSIKISYREVTSMEVEESKFLGCDVETEYLENLMGNGNYTVTIQTIHPDDGGKNSTEKEDQQWTLPSRVSNFNISEVNPNNVTVSWDFPKDNVRGNNLDRYVLTVHDLIEDETCIQRITFSENGDDNGGEGNCSKTKRKKYGTSQNVTYTVLDLEPCSLYRLKVYAENTEGRGSDEYESTSTSVGEPTNEARIINITTDINAVDLEWLLSTEPARCNIVKSEISYTFQDCSSPDVTRNETQEVPGNVTQAQVAGLQAYTNYTFTVTSYTDAGPGVSGSDEEMSTTLEDKPGPPTDVSIQNFTHKAIQISWQEPAACEQNGILTGYNVSWIFVDPDDPSDGMKGGSGREIVPGLTYFIDAKPYKDYTVTVAAITAVGEGNRSQEMNQRTKEWVGGTVDSDTIEFDTSEEYKIEVRWDPPPEPQGVIIEYTVAFKNTPGGPCDTYSNLNCTGNRTVSDITCLLDSLQPDQEFEFSITASTAIGAGNPSDRTTEKSAVVKPLTPENVSVETTSASVLRVSWTKPEYYPGHTEYEVHVRDDEIPKDSKNKSVKGYENVTVDVSDLDPYWNYSVFVVAKTEEGESNPTPEEPVKMPEADPRAVKEFTVEQETADCLQPQMDLRWKKLQGKDRRGDIQNYTVCYWEADGNAEEKSKSFVESVNGDYQEEALTSEDGIDAEKQYNFKIAAYSKVAKGESKEDDAYAGACPPQTPSGEELNSTAPTSTVREPESVEGIDRRRQAVVELKAEFYSDESNGAITRRGIYVAQEDSNADSPRTEIVDKDSLLVTTWEEANDDKSFIQPYRVDLPIPVDGLSSGNRQKRNVPEWEKVTVGEDRNCEGEEGFECNGYLPDGRSYRLRVFVCTEAGCTITSASQAIVTDKDVTGAIVGGVLGTVIFIALVLLLILFLDRRGIITLPRREETENPPDFSMLPVEDNYPPPQAVTRNRPVTIGNFQAHVKELHRDSNLGFSAEYEEIKRNCAQKPHTFAELPANRVKNRYINILPFDDTRVKLLPVEDDEGSDYINGNFMMGFNSKREFIALQGPLPATCDDFWRVVWEQNVPMIVMVTKCKEKEREKCAQYWPEKDMDAHMYGDIHVVVRSESHLGDYVIRVIDLQMGKVTRIVKQFHFLAWPDFGCPDTTHQLLNFVTMVRAEIRPSIPGPILVHCSAGVGRTGTFIVVDRVLQEIREGRDIDIFGIVMEMRENRCHMVQTEDQYVYIHDCIRDAIIKRMHLLTNEPIYTNEAYESDDPDEQEQENLYENYNPAAADQMQGGGAPDV